MEKSLKDRERYEESKRFKHAQSIGRSKGLQVQRDDASYRVTMRSGGVFTTTRADELVRWVERY